MLEMDDQGKHKGTHLVQAEELSFFRGKCSYCGRIPGHIYNHCPAGGNVPQVQEAWSLERIVSHKNLKFSPGSIYRDT